MNTHASSAARAWPAALVLLLTIATSPTAPAQVPAAAARYDAAQLEYENGHYQVAFDEFALLADGGHCEAARIARQMLRHGRSLYGITFKLAAERPERWARMPGCAAALAALR